MPNYHIVSDKEREAVHSADTTAKYSNPPYRKELGTGMTFLDDAVSSGRIIDDTQPATQPATQPNTPAPRSLSSFRDAGGGFDLLAMAEATDPRRFTSPTSLSDRPSFSVKRTDDTTTANTASLSMFHQGNASQSASQPAPAQTVQTPTVAPRSRNADAFANADRMIANGQFGYTGMGMTNTPNAVPPAPVVAGPAGPVQLPNVNTAYVPAIDGMYDPSHYVPLRQQFEQLMKHNDSMSIILASVRKRQDRWAKYGDCAANRDADAREDLDYNIVNNILAHEIVIPAFHFTAFAPDLESVYPPAPGGAPRNPAEGEADDAVAYVTAMIRCIDRDRIAKRQPTIPINIPEQDLKWLIVFYNGPTYQSGIITTWDYIKRALNNYAIKLVMQQHNGNYQYKLDNNQLTSLGVTAMYAMLEWVKHNCGFANYFLVRPGTLYDWNGAIAADNTKSAYGNYGYNCINPVVVPSKHAAHYAAVRDHLPEPFTFSTSSRDRVPTAAPTLPVSPINQGIPMQPVNQMNLPNQGNPTMMFAPNQPYPPCPPYQSYPACAMGPAMYPNGMGVAYPTALVQPVPPIPQVLPMPQMQPGLPVVPVLPPVNPLTGKPSVPPQSAKAAPKHEHMPNFDGQINPNCGPMNPMNPMNPMGGMKNPVDTIRYSSPKADVTKNPEYQKALQRIVDAMKAETPEIPYQVFNSKARAYRYRGYHVEKIHTRDWIGEPTVLWAVMKVSTGEILTKEAVAEPDVVTLMFQRNEINLNDAIHGIAPDRLQYFFKATGIDPRSLNVNTAPAESTPAPKAPQTPQPAPVQTGAPAQQPPKPAQPAQPAQPVQPAVAAVPPVQTTPAPTPAVRSIPETEVAAIVKKAVDEAIKGMSLQMDVLAKALTALTVKQKELDDELKALRAEKNAAPAANPVPVATPVVNTPAVTVVPPAQPVQAPAVPATPVQQAVSAVKIPSPENYPTPEEFLAALPDSAIIHDRRDYDAPIIPAFAQTSNVTEDHLLDVNNEDDNEVIYGDTNGRNWEVLVGRQGHMRNFAPDTIRVLLNHALLELDKWGNDLPKIREEHKGVIAKAQEAYDEACRKRDALDRNAPEAQVFKANQEMWDASDWCDTVSQAENIAEGTSDLEIEHPEANNNPDGYSTKLEECICKYALAKHQISLLRRHAPEIVNPILNASTSTILRTIFPTQPSDPRMNFNPNITSDPDHEEPLAPPPFTPTASEMPKGTIDTTNVPKVHWLKIGNPATGAAYEVKGLGDPTPINEEQLARSQQLASETAQSVPTTQPVATPAPAEIMMNLMKSIDEQTGNSDTTVKDAQVSEVTETAPVESTPADAPAVEVNELTAAPLTTHTADGEEITLSGNVTIYDSQGNEMSREAALESLKEEAEALKAQQPHTEPMIKEAGTEYTSVEINSETAHTYYKRPTLAYEPLKETPIELANPDPIPGRVADPNSDIKTFNEKKELLRLGVVAYEDAITLNSLKYNGITKKGKVKMSEDFETRAPYVTPVRESDSGLSATRGACHYLPRHTRNVFFNNDALLTSPRVEEIPVEGSDWNDDNPRPDADTFFRIIKREKIAFSKTEDAATTVIRINEPVLNPMDMTRSLIQYYRDAFKGADKLGLGKYGVIVSYDEIQSFHTDFNAITKVIDDIAAIYRDDITGEYNITPENTVKAIHVLREAAFEFHKKDDSGVGKIMQLIINRWNEIAQVEMSRLVPINDTDGKRELGYTCLDVVNLTDIENLCTKSDEIMKDFIWVDADTKDFDLAMKHCLESSFGAIWSRGYDGSKSPVPPYLNPDNPDDHPIMLGSTSQTLRFGRNGKYSSRDLLMKLNSEEMTEELNQELREKLSQCLFLRVERKVLLTNITLPVSTCVEDGSGKIYIDDLAVKNYCSSIYNDYGTFLVSDLSRNAGNALKNPMVMGYDWDNNLSMLPAFMWDIC